MLLIVRELTLTSREIARLPPWRFYRPRPRSISIENLLRIKEQAKKWSKESTILSLVRSVMHSSLFSERGCVMRMFFSWVWVLSFQLCFNLFYLFVCLPLRAMVVSTRGCQTIGGFRETSNYPEAFVPLQMLRFERVFLFF